MLHEMYSISPPGYMITLAYLLFGGLFVWLNRRRYGPVRTILTQAVWLAAILSLSFLIESPDRRLYLVRFLLILSLVYFSMYSLMRVPALKCLYFQLYAFTLAEFTTALEWHLYYFGTRVKHVPDILPIRIPFFVGVYGGVLLIAALFYSRFRDYNRELEVRRKDVLQAAGLALLVFLAANASNYFSETPFSSADPGQIFMIRTLMNLTGVVSMYLLYTARRDADTRLQAEHMQMLMQQMYENYRVNRSSIEMVSQKYHDLKHQIAWLRDGIDTQEKRDSLDRLEQDLSAFEAQADTGCEVLDTLLTSARLSSQKDGVQITCIADGAQLAFMDPMDQASLLGNLLDNAVEAVLQIPDRGRRLINLTVGMRRNFLVISCENCCEGTRRMEGGLPVTTKSDASEHGYGTKSISGIAARYGGSAQFSASDDWFTVKIAIPR